MTENILDKYTFKKYLLANLADCRQEELIFWKKNIPIPVDLIFTLFEKRNILLGKYLDHIGAAYLSAYIDKENGADWVTRLVLQPKAYSQVEKDFISKNFEKYMVSSGVTILLLELAAILMLEDYIPDEVAFAEAISHEGRKYKRLWLPPTFRRKIEMKFPELLDNISISNWDMFSNVVADELKVYRMGFADAFSGIFNKLIEFILVKNQNEDDQIKFVSVCRISQQIELSQDNVKINYGIISDGSIWEPRYQNGKTSFILNSNHPFSAEIKKLEIGSEQVIGKLIEAMSIRESEFLHRNDQTLIENFRQDVSRQLRIKSESES